MKAVVNLWEKSRSWLMFGIACALSPCCTPLIVPIVLAVLAGTPAAIWMTSHLGWVYGGLTAISVLSLVVGLFWTGKKRLLARNIARLKNMTIPIRDLTNAEPQHD